MSESTTVLISFLGTDICTVGEAAADHLHLGENRPDVLRILKEFEAHGNRSNQGLFNQGGMIHHIGVDEFVKVLEPFWEALLRRGDEEEFHGTRIVVMSEDKNGAAFIHEISLYFIEPEHICHGLTIVKHRSPINWDYH